MVFTPTQKPQALGKVAVVTPGTPVSLVSSLITAGIMTVGAQLPTCKLALWAPPTSATKTSGWGGPVNVGTIYLGYAGMNKTTLAGVIATIPPGGFWESASASTSYYLDQLVIDADNAGDSLYGNTDTN